MLSCLNVCRWHQEIKKTWTGCLLDSLGKNLLKRTYCCFRFRFCHDRLYFCVRMPFIDLLFNEFGFVLQLGKIVASIEQKPVSLNDIVTCRTPIKNERDY